MAVQLRWVGSEAVRQSVTACVAPRLAGLGEAGRRQGAHQAAPAFLRPGHAKASSVEPDRNHRPGLGVVEGGQRQRAAVGIVDGHPVARLRLGQLVRVCANHAPHLGQLDGIGRWLHQRPPDEREEVGRHPLSSACARRTVTPGGGSAVAPGPGLACACICPKPVRTQAAMSSGSFDGRMDVLAEVAHPHEVLGPGGVQVAHQLRIRVVGQGAALDGAPGRAAPDRLRSRVAQQEAERRSPFHATDHAEGAVLAGQRLDQRQGQRQGPRRPQGGWAVRVAGVAGGSPAARPQPAGRLRSAARRR